MADIASTASVIAAVASAVATAFAAFATWHAPKSAANLAETLRRDAERSDQRQRYKLHLFATLMQERAAIYTENAVRVLNTIDVVFHDSRPVREAWAELFLVFGMNSIPPHVLDERLRKLLIAMAQDIGLGDELRVDDIGRVYYPKALTEERLIKDTQRQQLLSALQGETPAANTAIQTLTSN